MAKQNIYDNECFFEGYKKIRQNEINANILFEIPELFALLPDLNGKTILDMGCGFGEHCTKFVELGAAAVVGIDISKKMLEVAEAENGHPSISYIHMPIEEISKLHKKFDIVISSLAMHYVENYEAVVRDVYQLLKDGGIFVFSQEHPLTTCFSSGDRWTKDENGKKLYLNLMDYGVEGERETTWFVDGVKKYHRTFSTMLNTLIQEGFCIESVTEPLLTIEILEKYPDYADLFHKPDFLLIKAGKKNCRNCD